MEKLTEKQTFILNELKKFMANKGYPPTVRELCKITDLSSTATVQVHLIIYHYFKTTKYKKRSY